MLQQTHCIFFRLGTSVFVDKYDTLRHNAIACIRIDRSIVLNTDDLHSVSHYKKRQAHNLINPLTAKLFNLNFRPLEVVSR